MKKSVRKGLIEKANRIISAAMVLAYVAAVLPAQEVTRAFDGSRSRLDYYLDRAGLEYDEAGWEQKAETGLREALSYWESENTYLKESDQDEYMRQRGEAEAWLGGMVHNQQYFENVIAASLYYDFYVNSAEGRSANSDKYNEDVYKVLTTGDTASFQVQGYSKAHGENVGGAFKSYVYGYLKSAYDSVADKSDIAKCILLRESGGTYESAIWAASSSLVKKHAYADMYGWFRRIANSHWFTKKFFRRILRRFDATGKWADQGEDVFWNVTLGENVKYNGLYEKISSSVSAMEKAVGNAARAKGVYLKVTTGSETSDGSPVKGSVIRQTIRGLLDGNSRIYSTVDVETILGRIGDDDEYTDVTEAMKALLETFKGEADDARDSMEAEKASLASMQEKAAAMYDGRLGEGLSVSAEDDEKLRMLAMKASDLTLTITERTEASRQYDELFRSLDADTGSLGSSLAQLAEHAWGAGTHDSTMYADSSASLFESYIKGGTPLFVDGNRTSEIYMQQALENWYANYSNTLDEANRARLEEYAGELEYSADSFRTQNGDLIGQLYDIRDAASTEWGKAEEKLNAAYNTWRRDFLKAYQRNTAEWKSGYDGFLEDKQEWITTMYMEAADQTSYQEEETAELAARSLAKARQAAAESMQGAELDSARYVEELLGGTGIPSLERHIEEASSRLGRTRGVSVLNTSGTADTMAGLLASQRMAAEVTAEMEAAASRLAAARAAESLNENIQASYAMIDRYNQYYEDYVKDLVLGAGYSWTRNGSTRKVAVDTSLVKTTYEVQHVGSFQWYRTSLPEVTVSTALLGSLEGEALTLAMAQDESDLEEWRRDIFGSGKNKGEFQDWVGDGGTLKADPDPDGSLRSNTAYEGTGQLGPIILDFSWNEIRKNRGIQELGKAAWDQKIWSGDCLGFEPPSIRTVATVAAAATAAVVTAAAGAVATPFTGGASAGIAAAACSAMVGAAMGAAITFTNECLFAVLDLAGEYKSPEEIGKQLATSAASSAIGILGAGAGSAVSGLSGIGGVLAKTGVSAATSVTTTVATNAIQHAGDWDAFADSMKNFDTWKGCISSTAGSLVTNSLNSIALGAGNIKVDSFNSTQIGSISSLNSTIGSLASTAITFGLTGEATFNILNISDFGAGASSGLLEVTIGGKKGFSSRLGTGGADISSGTLKTALAGLNNLNMNSKIKNAAKANGMENAATALRMQYGFGNEKQLKQLDEILSGETKLAKGTGHGDAQTVKENGQKTVYLNNYKGDMTREEMLAMGITLGHEAYRDGVVGTEEAQKAETRRAVKGHTEMLSKMLDDGMYAKVMNGLVGKNENLQMDLLAYSLGIDKFNRYIDEEYDSSQDYWKLISRSDGTHTIEWDGSRNITIEYQDKDDNGDWEKVGQDKFTDDTGSMAGSLGKLLGKTRMEEELGSSLYNADLYDRQTLRDVLGYSDDEITKIQRRGILPSSISDLQLNKLAGEALMKKSGISWDTSKGEKNGFWNVNGLTDSSTKGNKLTNLTVTDNITKGYILFNQQKIDENFNGVGNTYFDRFVVTAEVNRKNESWDGYVWGHNERQPNEFSHSAVDNNTISKSDNFHNQNRELDEIIYTKWDLNNNKIASYSRKVQTVDVFIQGGGENRDQPYQMNGKWVQGNTINSDFSLRIDSLTAGDTYAMTIHNAKTVNGTWVHNDGNAYNADGTVTKGGRWRVHSSDWLTSDGCFIYQQQYLEELQKQLKLWGMHNNHQIKGWVN